MQAPWKCIVSSMCLYFLCRCLHSCWINPLLRDCVACLCGLLLVPEDKGRNSSPSLITLYGQSHLHLTGIAHPSSFFHSLINFSVHFAAHSFQTPPRILFINHCQPPDLVLDSSRILSMGLGHYGHNSVQGSNHLLCNTI